MDPVAFAGAGVALGAIGTQVHDLLSGRSLVRDTAERGRLSLRTLAGWDAACAANPRRSELVVCLTTTPSRIQHLQPTLASLLAQSVRPASIRVHVPWECRRERQRYELPPWLSQLTCVEVVRCDDAGPATKLLPALSACAPDARLLVVDDDRIYPRNLVAAFDAASRREPDVAWGTSGWVVPPDFTDRPTTLVRNLRMQAPAPVRGLRVARAVRVDVLQGQNGYLVQPRFFDAAVSDYSRAPEAAFFVDDVWLSAHCRVPKCVLPGARCSAPVLATYRLHDRTSISRLNRGGGDHEMRHNTIMIRHLQAAWLSGAHPG